MSKEIAISSEEVMRIFNFIERIHEFMHQPLNYSKLTQVNTFISENCSEAHDLYYKVLRNLLTAEMRAEVEDR